MPEAVHIGLSVRLQQRGKLVSRIAASGSDLALEGIT